MYAVVSRPFCPYVGCRKDVTFTLQDMHSLLLMLCPDVPLRVTRSAFKAATPLLPSGGLS